MEVRWLPLHQWITVAVVALFLPTVLLTPDDNGRASSSTLHFTQQEYNVSISENSNGKTYVTPEEKMGIYRRTQDVDIRYKISSGDRDKFFKAEEQLVGDFWFLLIRTRTGNTDVLNRERKDKYTLYIKATITHREGKKASYGEATCKVHVNVLDTNDLNPLFYPTEYEETVPEDLPLHTSILRVSAEDADLGRNGEIYYSFQDFNEQFAIHPTSGVVTLTRPLKYAEKSVHDLVVLGQDRGSVFKGGGKASSAKLKIKVKQINLYSPEIYVQSLPDIVEQSYADIYAIVRVVERDSGVHGEIASLDIVDGDPDGHFRIVPTKTDLANKKREYNIVVLKLLDREIAPLGYNLTLRAVDKGTPPRETYKSTHVHLVDLNDNKPVFDREMYEVDVPETTPVNTPIIRLKVSDADDGKNAQVFLEIVGGNEGGEFYINPETGMLYTAVLLDAEEKAFYTLTVSAIDQGNTGTRKQSAAKVKINIVDTNDNDPLFDSPEMDVNIDENEPPGTTVVKVTARDRDSGENAYISYSIANLKPVPFEIDHFSGVVKTAQILDYESMRREYILRIRASDWGLPYRRQTEIQLKIKLVDVNDNRPQFEKVDCMGHVPRNLPIGREIMTLSAIDFDAGNIISYRIVSGNEDGCFALDLTSGVLSIACDLTDVKVNERELNVTATDGSHFSDVVRIRINLVSARRIPEPGRTVENDTGGFECKDTGVARRLTEVLAAAEKNNIKSASYQEEFAMMPSRYGENIHVPEFTYFPIELQVNESIPLRSNLTKIIARDRDLGYNGKLVFGISSGDNDSVFRIDPDSGELKVVGYLDRERTAEYTLNITVYDLGRPQKSTSKMLPIIVVDVNDNAPKFEKSLASFRVTENALNGTAIFKVNATDLDLGENAHVVYSLMTDTQDFAVDSVTGVLYVAAPLDRERQELYELKIRASDCGGRNDMSTLHSDALVRVTIDDVNDNAPNFALPNYSVKIREDVPIGTVVAILSASDPDLGQGGFVRYSIVSDTEADNVFSIDRQTGTVRVAKSLDFEKRQVHSLVIRAKDNGSPPLFSEANLIVEVSDVNENLNAPVFGEFVYQATVKENQPIGTLVISLKATDADPSGMNSKIGYSIRGGDGLGLFTIDNEGNIRTSTILDVESKASYWLTVFAQDHGVVPLHSRADVYVQVTNVNDNVPMTVEPVYYAHVRENQAGTQPIVQLAARDDDLDPNQRISYKITSGNPESFFNIDIGSGLISTTGRKLDRENQAEHVLEVTVTDDGKPSLSSTTRVIISVDDVNDNAPIFEQTFYHINIPETRHQEQPLSQAGSAESEATLEVLFENSTWENFHENNITGDFLFRVLASDKDEGNNSLLRFDIKSGKGRGKFSIHPTTGAILSAQSFSVGQQFDLLVRATDHGHPNNSATARVSIQVVRLPDESAHAPVIKHPDQTVEVTENDSVGFLVALIQATDEDGDTLWYRIVDGDPNSTFAIGNDKGNVLLARKLDWETQSKYVLNISVTDGIHVVFTKLFVTVVDVNEHRPVLTQSLYRVNVSESVPIGSELIRIQAYDADQENKVLYSIHHTRSQVSGNLFKIDYHTGSLTVAQALDRESISQHILTIMVRDQGTPAKRNFARVIIDVFDANDHPPEFSSNLIVGRVFETCAVGTDVVQVVATDRDHGENARITYSITSGNIGNVYSMDEKLGMIQTARPLDINLMSEYMLIVKATDNGSPPLVATVPVQIMVVMADNDPPRFTKSELAAELFENEPPGTVVRHIEARSTSSLVFEIVRGDVDDMFMINPSTGVLVTKKPLDYEANRIYNLSITATNMAGAKAVCKVIVHVLDRNDNTPYFTQLDYFGFINEAAPIGALVLTNSSLPLVIQADDQDSETNSLLEYAIVESVARRMFHIVASTGAIRTVVNLDHETLPRIVFHVQVTDHGKPQLTSDTLAKVTVLITDSNDCPPKFSQDVYNASILMPTFTNVAVVQLNATDDDSKNLTKLVYAIEKGNEAHIYDICADTGLITLKEASTGAKSAPHSLKVSVKDGRFTSYATVNVVWEKSENSGLTFQKSLYQGSVMENTTKVNTVAVVTVIGSSLNENLEFSILNPTPLFQIGRTSGVLRTSGLRFDRETQDHYQLIVQAKSEDENSRSTVKRVAHVPVNITVLDTNDNCPMFVNLPYYAVVPVDAQKGEIITKVHAIDLDKGENGEVRYELSKGHGELFKVDRNNGEISLKQVLEGHNKDYVLHIAAFDKGIQPCSTEVSVNVKVIDRSMPVFDKQFYAVSVREDIQIHSPLPFSIRAESPLNRKLIYSIVAGNQREQFSVDFNTGSITVADELDYEKLKEYTLTVRATDSVSGHFAEVFVSVIVTDVNDCPPEFSQDAYNISISEASPFGTFILKLSAHDGDSGINSQIRYSLGNTSGDMFHIEPDDGSLYTKRSLDHEVQSLYHIPVIATDQGTPTLSSLTHVWLTVLDINDNPPKLEQTSYLCFLSEDAARGQFVTVISASDPDTVDHDKLAYSIVGGNQQQTFSMDSRSGIITLINLHKLAESKVHILNVSVSDGVYTSFAKVRVEMLPANKVGPQFEKHQYDVKMMENQAPGSRVVRVHAQDSDSDQIVYSIPSQMLLDTFYMNNATGEVMAKISLDRETKKVYEIPVIATDQGGRSGFTTIRLRVADDNDNAPVFLLPEYKISVPSNLAVNSGFLKVKAADLDEDLNAQIEYSIYERESKGVKDLFTINKHTGGLSLTKSPASYENQVFQFFVRASDRGTSSLHADVPIEVYMMDPNDQKPMFEHEDDKFFISEASPIGSVITTVKLVSTIPVKFKLISGEPTFTIDRDGQISLAERLDREMKAVYTIGVMAYTDSSPPLSALSEVTVQILDVNDNTPMFHSESYSIAIVENIPEGTPILKVHADDADEGSNGEVRYALQGSAADMFSIEPYTGWLNTVVSLDREQQASYNLIVVATDSGTPALSATANVHITLIDDNDNPPVFSQDSYASAVNEDALPGTVIVQLTITDADSETTPTVFYITEGDSHAQFAIRTTGEVYVARPLDRETVDSYMLTVVVTDGKFVSYAKLDVDVLDANDERPYCLKYRYRQSISEGVLPGSYVLNVAASDNDLDPKLRFYLTGENSDHFTLDTNTGELKTARGLDREKISHYSLNAHVQDRDHLTWECVSLILLSITDINDNAPEFNTVINTAAILENADIGSLVTKIHATDDDIGINRKIKYSLLDSADGYFNIASDSGIITLAKTLDRETVAAYNLTIKATDQGSPPLSTLSILQVSVLDVNDNPPEFVSRSYSSTIPENASPDTEVARVLATSLDTGVNAQVTYAIIGGNEHGKFFIDTQTGVICIADALDYEKAREYLLTIQATDLGVPPLYNQATVNISVTDVNDNAPEFTQMSFSAVVSEDLAPGEVVTQITATDLDSGVNGKVVYSIEKGDRHQQFSIDKHSGHIMVSRPLDREMVASYQLQIRACDSGVPELASFTMLNIEVGDVNDNPPMFSQHNYTAIVQEDKLPGWAVCHLSVTDADIDPNGPPYTFDIRSGDSNGVFRVEPDGTVRTAAKMSFRVKENFLLQVRVFDNGTPPLYADTWLIIKVIEESQFPPAVTPLEIWVGSYQDRWPGGELGRVHATDQDPYDTLSYFISHPRNSLFSIDERSGAIMTAPGLDSGVYHLNISVSDGKFTSFLPIKLTVEPLWDDVLQHSLSIRLSGVTPHHFVLSERKALLRALKSALNTNIHLLSVQTAGHGDLDVLLHIEGGIHLDSLNEALKSVGLNTISWQCECLNGVCKQRVTFVPDTITPIATDVTSFVSPGHNHLVYCACHAGFAGNRCEAKASKCSCSNNEKCSAECVNALEPPCASNNTCSVRPPPSSIYYNVTLEQLIMAGAALTSLLFLICCILCVRKCRRARRRRRNNRLDKEVSVLNSEVKRTSKLSNLQVSQHTRPASYTGATNNDILYTAVQQLNNLDTLRSYGSAGDELEMPADYLRNLNHAPANKINNDLKRNLDTPPKIPRRTVSCADDDITFNTKSGYHWDCSDWVRPSHALPNITEVPGSEVPDSSSIHSNDSHETQPLNPAALNMCHDPIRDLETLNEELYLSYRSDEDEEDDVIPYGFPRRHRHLSQSDMSTNLCEIEDSDREGHSSAV